VLAGGSYSYDQNGNMAGAGTDQHVRLASTSPYFLKRSNPCESVSICVQVDRTRINKGFLEAMDGHCQ
jgi:hypothetical protein